MKAQTLMKIDEYNYREKSKNLSNLLNDDNLNSNASLNQSIDRKLSDVSGLQSWKSYLLHK